MTRVRRFLFEGGGRYVATAFLAGFRVATNESHTASDGDAATTGVGDSTTPPSLPPLDEVAALGLLKQAARARLPTASPVHVPATHHVPVPAQNAASLG